MQKCISLLFSTACALSVCGAAFAYDPEDPITSIVISPTRSPTPINRIASSITVIDHDTIKQQNRASVVDLLRQVPGVTVANNGGQGQTSRLFMRGTNSNHVLVLVDGVALNDPSDPSDAFDFSNLSTDNIERIEVLRGPQSTLYGSQAIGGVISIISKQGRGKPRYNAFAEYGRYTSSRAGVGSAGEIGRTSYSFEARNSFTKGISSFDKQFGGREKDGSENYTFSANISSKLTDNVTAKLSGRYGRNITQFDSPGGFTRPSDDPLPYNDSRQFTGRAAGEVSLMDGKWTQEMSVSMLHLNRGQITEYFDAMFNTFFGRQQYQGWREKVDWVHRIKLLPYQTLTVGAEASTDHLKSDTLSEINVDNRAVFVDDQISFGEDIFVGTGMRLDDQQSFGKQFTWKVAPGYVLRATGTRLKASYGTGFKAPSLSQLFDTSSGNPQLNPEKSKGWDAGFEQPLWDNSVSFGATFFRNNIRQLIGFNPAPPFASINTGKARTEGVESALMVKPFTGLTLNASHVYTLPQDRTRDKELLRRPRHQVNVNATYDYSTAGDIGMNIRYSGERRDIDINAPYGLVYVKSFSTIDLTTNYHVNEHVTLYGRVENLLDKRYEEVYAYGQPGMSLFAGVKTNF
ncbi:MAG: TonB-dependent receptor domain-containing protein [Alphaproteobacteria bacterium]